jgi:hypothetical protein
MTGTVIAHSLDISTERIFLLRKATNGIISIRLFARTIGNAAESEIVFQQKPLKKLFLKKPSVARFI